MVVDTSAWARQSDPQVRARWQETLHQDLLVICPAGALELLSAARDQPTFVALEMAMAALPQAPVTASVCRAALGAARELGGRRRIPAIDYLIAAAAAERGFDVLHLDAHFDTLATVLAFESVRLDAPL